MTIWSDIEALPLILLHLYGKFCVVYRMDSLAVFRIPESKASKVGILANDVRDLSFSLRGLV